MKVIIPCCGNSSRFPDLPPKWMLPDHTGRPMIAEAASLLNIPSSDIVVTALTEHESKFQVTRGLKKALGSDIQVVLLDKKTNSQSETLYETIQCMELSEPFLVKDSDNCFKIDQIQSDCGYVCYDSLNNHSLINPKNKSYLQLDGQGTLINIKEKRVISDTFSVGGYYFTDPVYFSETYSKLIGITSVEKNELYISDIILSMLLDGAPFRGKSVTSYQDWGTILDWKRYLLSKKTYFIALDGYLFERGSEYFEPTFENARPNKKSVETIKELLSLGHSLIMLSIRSEIHSEMTRKNLSALGFGDIPVLYNCPLSKWELITPPFQGIGFRTCDSHELNPLSDVTMEQLLQ